MHLAPGGVRRPTLDRGTPPEREQAGAWTVETAAAPRYTPDGCWFWNGTRWIPAAEVLRPPVAPVRPPRPEPVQRGRRQRPPLAAVAVAVALVVVVLVAAVDLMTAFRTDLVPPAQQVFELPFVHEVPSAGVRGTVTSQGVVETIAGVLDFTPDRALDVSLHVGAAYAGEYLDSDGIDYQTQEPGGPWDEGTPVSFIDRALGWTGGPPPLGLHVAGRQVMSGERAWHLLSSSGAGWWIGARSGHPLAFAYRSHRLALNLTFEGFGMQPAIMIPPQSNISTLPLEGSPGTLVTAPEMSMEVNAVRPAPPALGSPPTGYRYQALDLSYRNQSPRPVTFDNAFTLTGDHGTQYQESDSVRMTPVLPRGLMLQPGQVVSGWDVFVVSRSARELTLRAGPQSDEEDLDFLVSIPLS